MVRSFPTETVFLTSCWFLRWPGPCLTPRVQVMLVTFLSPGDTALLPIEARAPLLSCDGSFGPPPPWAAMNLEVCSTLPAGLLEILILLFALMFQVHCMMHSWSSS